MGGVHMYNPIDFTFYLLPFYLFWEIVRYFILYRPYPLWGILRNSCTPSGVPACYRLLIRGSANATPGYHRGIPFGEYAEHSDVGQSLGG